MWRGPLRARLAWEFFSTPNSTLHKWLRHKYGSPNADTDHHQFDSITWSIIKKGARSLHRVTRWRIVDGADISVMNNIWLGGCLLADCLTFLDVAGLEDLRVAELLSGESWDLERVQRFFGPELVEVISRVEIGGLAVGLRDKVELVSQFSGATITALAYLKHFPNDWEQNAWLRKLRLHPRERMFWWRVCLDAILTNCWLVRRRLSEVVSCLWDCPGTEDRDHVTTTYCFLHRVLAVLDSWGFSLPRFSDFQSLLASLRHLPGAMRKMALLYYAAVYQCWSARNAKRLGRAHGSPSIIAATILENLRHADFGASPWKLGYQPTFAVVQELSLVSPTPRMA